MTAFKRITKLEPHQVFVFGSDFRGIHGKGAALDARKLFGAVNGIGEGLQGQSYAIPTKGAGMHPLSLSAIEQRINLFLICAQEHPELEFLVTPIGTGLAGYTVEQIQPLFGEASKLPPNVKLLF